ncbi:TlpA family protein disulfide reductase [Flavobacterium pectinovorum]|uniref:TlpA family protein disulfide reductase n=1 Tax=Flavobacterium pectinovorum TaxID=29533 RepID=UPI001FADF5D8|nr:TlpA disulfide reductase family protein [Flavobacterium pectinovorum]MCI9846432.1 TlpA family protein disulfide reductase [Flavobacterium pectinovorum]
MRNSTLLLLCSLIGINNYSQEIKNNQAFIDKKNKTNSIQTTSKVVVLDKVIQGIGPAGISSSGIASRDMISEEELKGYPKMKNIPDSLTNLKEYLFILNDFQFCYQNYKQGIYSKDFFIKEAEKNKMNLKDTIHLSDKKVKNTISIVAGYTSNKSIVYIVDSNNNDDYSDDIPKKLLSNLNKQDDILDNAVNVDIEYFDGKSIQKDKQLITVEQNLRGKDFSLMFKFPQYRYGKVQLGNDSYLIISESNNRNQSIYLAKDQPYFDRLDKNNIINPSQYLKINDNYIQYSPITQNLSKIKLTISHNDLDNKATPTANQVGMMAPNISGINILDQSKISLEKYKGKYVFLDFWSTTCAPCIKEFPKIKEVFDKFSQNDIEIIGIVDVRGKMDIKNFINNQNVTWQNIDEKNPLTINKGYNVNSWPTTYLIDPDGKIIDIDLRGDDLNNKLELLKLAKK